MMSPDYRQAYEAVGRILRSELGLPDDCPDVLPAIRALKAERDALREAVENSPRWSLREVDAEDGPLYDGMETDEDGEWINAAELIRRANAEKGGKG